MKRFVLQVALIALLTACAGQVRFLVEEEFQFTFRHTGQLNAGDVLSIRLEGLGPNEVFHINRCGKLCNTSKVVDYRRGGDGAIQEFTTILEESGEYYFWIQRSLANGEAGPVRIVSVKSRGAGFRARFATGAIAEGSLWRKSRSHRDFSPDAEFKQGVREVRLESHASREPQVVRVAEPPSCV